ncbi:MAG: hypothetical protein LBC61_07560 [Candidatus Peribacteria bacterium]|nr:hypothetical protein [Candidatus Peribacteria bacterium]
MPTQKIFKNDIFILKKNFNGAKDNDLVAVKVKKWE